MTIDQLRDKDTGELPAYAWPGGYQIVYLFADGETCCPDCANGKNGSEATTDTSAERDWQLVGGDIYYEGAPLTCAHCGASIESAYGDPDADDNDA